MLPAQEEPMSGSRPRKRSVAKRPGRFHHGDLRWALLQAASLLLERDGTAGVGWRAIARLAGVSQTAPYRHFKDRESILVALAEEGFRTLGGRMSDAAREAGEPAAALAAIAGTYVALATERPHLFRLLFGPEVADKRRYPAVRDAGHRALGVVVETIAAGQRAGVVRAGDPAELAVCHWASVHGIAQLLVDGMVSERADAAGGPVALGRLVAGLVWTGLAPRDR
jgi:AcrR family transcriptional regulator